MPAKKIELIFTASYGTCGLCNLQGTLRGTSVQKICLLVCEEKLTKAYCVACSLKVIEDLKFEAMRVGREEQEYKKITDGYIERYREELKKRF